MLPVIDRLACAGCFVLMIGTGSVESRLNPAATAPSLWALPDPLITVGAAATTPTPCSDPMTIIRAFYDANDASRFEVSLGFLTEDATLSSWAEGVNGHHMRETHLTGKGQIRSALGNPGLQRTSSQPEGPIYHESKIHVSGDQVTFMLEPDRRRPNGKPYNPYRVEVGLIGCKIKSLTVIDLVTWL
jgi:hypothetical protein